MYLKKLLQSLFNKYRKQQTRVPDMVKINEKGKMKQLNNWEKYSRVTMVVKQRQ